MILALALSPSLDVTYEVNSLTPGDITRPTRVTHVAGGKALNVARVARALGADVQVVAALGGHSGRWIADLLAGDDVTATVVPLRRTTRICSAIVEAQGGASSTDIYEAATAFDADEWQSFSDEVARIADITIEGLGTPWVALSGSLPDGVAADDLAALLGAVRERGARIAVDSSGEGLRVLAPVADLVKVNRAEAAELLRRDLPTAAAAVAGLRERLPADIVVTDGTRGGSAFLGSTPLDFAPPDHAGRFSAGSGDAFLGGLLVALDRRAPAQAALDAARSAAERNAETPGQGVLAPLPV